MAWLCRWLEDRRGAAAVEAALVMPLLLLLMAGLIDGSRAIVQSMQVSAAAQAGADYARLHGWDAAAIQAAVRDATPLAVTAKPAPKLVTACATAKGVEEKKGGSCPGGPEQPAAFVVVSAEAPFSPIMPWKPLPKAPPKLRAEAVVRLP